MATSNTHSLQQHTLQQMQRTLHEYAHKVLHSIASEFDIPLYRLLDWYNAMFQKESTPAQTPSPDNTGKFCHFILDRERRKCMRLAKKDCKYCAWHDPSVRENYQRFWVGTANVQSDPDVAASAKRKAIAAADAAGDDKVEVADDDATVAEFLQGLRSEIDEL